MKNVMIGLMIGLMTAVAAVSALAVSDKIAWVNTAEFDGVTDNVLATKVNCSATVLRTASTAYTLLRAQSVHHTYTGTKHAVISRDKSGNTYKVITLSSGVTGGITTEHDQRHTAVNTCTKAGENTAIGGLI